MIYFIADTHFHHRKIIEYANRPFDKVYEMDKVMIDRWNRTVRPEDVVFHLGDFGFGPVNVLKHTLSLLNGRITLIKGNHDRGFFACLDLGFASVASRLQICLDGTQVLLSHRPLEVLPKGIDVVFHGHIHNGKPEDLDMAKEKDCPNRFNVNICVEKTNYFPISYKLALKWWRKQKEGYTK